MNKTHSIRLGKAIPYTLLILMAFSALANASTQQTIYTFPSNGANGSYPLGGLISDSAGNLYGTTEFGGANNLGVVFELSPAQNGTWAQTVLYSFKGSGSKDGAEPTSGVVIDSAGNLYGTTTHGGSSGLCSGGCGTAFKLSPNGQGGWSESVLYSFYGSKGEIPNGLIMDAKGIFYGTTMAGGSSGACLSGCGTVFKLKKNLNGTWTETVLHSFTGGPDGSMPYAGLTLDKLGNLLGTTVLGGGNSTCSNGCGTLFELSPAGKSWTEKIIYSFDYTNGAYPYAAPTVDSAGNLYGTTHGGGNSNNPGVVYRLTPTNGPWIESVLHTFSTSVDGAQPSAGLIFDGAGNLYGATPGGMAFAGTVFELTATQSGPWTETILYKFPVSGPAPSSGLIWNQAQTSLYGTAVAGNTGGTVYEVTP